MRSAATRAFCGPVSNGIQPWAALPVSRDTPPAFLGLVQQNGSIFLQNFDLISLEALSPSAILSC